MALEIAEIRQALKGVKLPDGGDPVTADMVRALSVEGGVVRFVIEAPSPEAARALESARAEAEKTVAALPGVTSVSVILTAHGPAAPQHD